MGSLHFKHVWKNYQFQAGQSLLEKRKNSETKYVTIVILSCRLLPYIQIFDIPLLFTSCLSILSLSLPLHLPALFQ